MMTNDSFNSTNITYKSIFNMDSKQQDFADVLKFLHAGNEYGWIILEKSIL